MGKVYYCLVCQKGIKGIYNEDLDNYTFVHDEVPHPVDMTFDEEDNPQ